MRLPPFGCRSRLRGSAISVASLSPNQNLKGTSVMGIWDIIAGFTASSLAAMGVGGGGLLVIYLTQAVGMEQRTAQGVNLIFFLCASVTALSVHLRKRRIAFRYALFFAIGGTVGAVIGCLFAQGVDNRILRCGFGILLIYAGGGTLYKILRARVL